MSGSIRASARPSDAPSHRLARRLWRQPRARVGAALLAVLALGALSADLAEALFGSGPQSLDLLARLEPPSAAHPLGTDELGRDVLVMLLHAGHKPHKGSQPCCQQRAAHPLGTDELGRDVLVMLLHAGRTSLLVGVGGALLAAGLGTLVGLVAGWYGGRLDALLMRLTDTVLALPLLPLLIVLAAVDLARLGLEGAGPLASALRIVMIVALFGWPTTARLVRTATVALERREFVLAARALGAGDGRILRRHILPHLAGPLTVATTLAVGQVVLAESVLSFLGLGIQPPLASWGTMLTRAQELVFEAPLQALWPGLAIFATVLGANLFGDALEEALDPRRHHEGHPVR